MSKLSDWLDKIGACGSAVCCCKHGHDYQATTKAREYIMSGKFWTQSWSPIPRLLNIPGKRWLCVEPLLGPVDLGLFCPRCGYSNYDCRVQMDHRLCGAPEPPRIDWVVVGQESGPGARPAKAEWIQSIIDQCKTAHIPVWTKALPPGVNPIRQAPADGSGRKNRR